MISNTSCGYLHTVNNVGRRQCRIYTMVSALTSLVKPAVIRGTNVALG